ncbi:HET-domain-containing protein [Imleria badia]|nr:HET-domain-containing protein [Imleria badia]
MPSQSLPTGPIADAFKEYINNEIPARFIHTSNLQFVSRKDVFSIFQDRIASVTEKQIQERIERLQSDPLASYQPRREMVLREIIQEIVEYDILSHRWDEITGEPTFQDISSGKQPVSKFKKLAQFCETSRKLGRNLAWVDTCCIDKANAAELSEAIHGMYKWYAHAYLCIVHLAESTSFSDWDRDSWFTRGWTLQELLAPKRVKFYNKNWLALTLSQTPDDDRKLANVISPLEKATGIPRAVLTADNSQGVHGHTFWEIMSWASRRQTTRVEDMAYSLVGLFHVSLTSIAYREGQRAFPRLVEAVSETNPSWDIFAWFGKPSPDHFALPSSPASYTGFEADVGRDRVGVQKFAITAYGLSLTSLPPIPMELGSVAQPEGPGKPFHVTLKPQSDSEGSMGRRSTALGMHYQPPRHAESCQ